MSLIPPSFFRNVVIALTVLLFTNFFVGVISTVFFPFGFFADKSTITIISDLAFVEGAAAFFVGAILAFFSNPKPRVISIMVIGASMIGISVVFGLIR